MKAFIFVFMILILFSCKVFVYTPDNFFDSVFVWDGGGMLGSDSISFHADSTFVYSERNGLFVSYGVWYFSDDGKSIIIKSSDYNGLKTVYDVFQRPMYIKIFREFSILSEEKIKDSRNAIFRKQ